MNAYLPFPIFILLAALLICLLVLLLLVLVGRAFDLAERLAVYTRAFEFKLLWFKFEGRDGCPQPSASGAVGTPRPTERGDP